VERVADGPYPANGAINSCHSSLPIDGYSFSARCGQLSHKDASLKLFFGEASLYTTFGWHRRFGGASKLDDSLNTRLKFLCNLGIARVAAEAEAAIIDGGTQAGILELMGQAVAERGHHRHALSSARCRAICCADHCLGGRVCLIPTIPTD
jgi:SLOG in TRPM, prokaryote